MATGPWNVECQIAYFEEAIFKNFQQKLDELHNVFVLPKIYYYGSL